MPSSLSIPKLFRLPVTLPTPKSSDGIPWAKALTSSNSAASFLIALPFFAEAFATLPLATAGERNGQLVTRLCVSRETALTRERILLRRLWLPWGGRGGFFPDRGDFTALARVHLLLELLAQLLDAAELVLEGVIGGSVVLGNQFEVGLRRDLVGDKSHGYSVGELTLAPDA